MTPAVFTSFADQSVGIIDITWRYCDGVTGPNPGPSNGVFYGEPPGVSPPPSAPPSAAPSPTQAQSTLLPVAAGTQGAASSVSAFIVPNGGANDTQSNVGVIANPPTGMNTAGVAGTVVGVLMFVALIIGGVFYYRRATKKRAGFVKFDEYEKYSASLEPPSGPRMAPWLARFSKIEGYNDRNVKGFSRSWNDVRIRSYHGDMLDDNGEYM